MDIKPPPKRPVSQVPPVPPVVDPAPILPPIDEPNEAKLPEKKHFSRTKKIILWIVGILVVILLAVGSVVGWYFWSLTPRSSDTAAQSVTIESGMTPAEIGALLEEKAIIRNAAAFEWYVRLNGVNNALQAGKYKLTANQSVGDVVGHLTRGENDTFNVIIIPGMTLDKLADPTVKKSLAAQGYTPEEITQAFAASYDSPLLADRPVGATLEGYIFPETYQVRASDSLQSLIQRSIDELYNQLQAENLISKFTERGLTIHQAITLASIVQKEVSNVDDQPQVAQVFLKRLNEDTVLGSDVTALYGAQKDKVSLPTDAGQAAVIAINHDSPYNTRMYKGLPPGPIANMNFSALQAVANPAAGDYLYFVAGDGEDQGKTFFSRTYEEHQAAIAAHCHVLCSQ